MIYIYIYKGGKEKLRRIAAICEMTVIKMSHLLLRYSVRIVTLGSSWWRKPLHRSYCNNDWRKAKQSPTDTNEIGKHSWPQHNRKTRCQSKHSDPNFSHHQWPAWLINTAIQLRFHAAGFFPFLVFFYGLIRVRPRRFQKYSEIQRERKREKERESAGNWTEIVVCLERASDRTSERKSNETVLEVGKSPFGYLVRITSLGILGSNYRISWSWSFIIIIISILFHFIIVFFFFFHS